MKKNFKGFLIGAFAALAIAAALTSHGSATGAGPGTHQLSTASGVDNRGGWG